MERDNWGPCFQLFLFDLLDCLKNLECLQHAVFPCFAFVLFLFFYMDFRLQVVFVRISMFPIWIMLTYFAKYVTQHTEVVGKLLGSVF